MEKDGRALFPRIEYTNQWQPVGRGDPLKDPTYDYMPPVLDRVKYWGERTSHRSKNDILVLGEALKKPPVNNQKDTANVANYGQIKRTYYSPHYQTHYLPQVHRQKQPQSPHYYVKTI